MASVKFKSKDQAEELRKLANELSLWFWFIFFSRLFHFFLQKKKKKAYLEKGTGSPGGKTLNAFRLFSATPAFWIHGHCAIWSVLHLCHIWASQAHLAHAFKGLRKSTREVGMVARPLGNSQPCGRQKAPRAPKRAPRQYPEPCDAESQRKWLLSHRSLRRGCPSRQGWVWALESFLGHEKELLASSRNPASPSRWGTQGRFWLKTLKTPWVSLDPAPEESASFSQLFCPEGRLLQWPEPL